MSTHLRRANRKGHKVKPINLNRSGASCIKLLPEKKSGYSNQSFLPMVKSMVNGQWSKVNSCLLEFSDFTRVFPPVKVLCNRPQQL